MEDNIKIGHKEMGWEFDWTATELRVIVITVMKFRIPQ